MVEQGPDISTFCALVSYRESSFSQRVGGKVAEKHDGVQEIRLPDAIGASDARKWPEADVDIHQILESGHT
jgi:hypothetical protein